MLTQIRRDQPFLFMDIAYWIYRFTTSALFILLLPTVLFRVISPERFKGISQRLGNYPADLLKDFSSKKRKVWVHASSVGEAGAAISIVNSLVSSYPEAMVIFSTTTRHGKAIAEKQLHGKISGCIYAPLDFMYAVRKALNSFKPDIIVFFETEIWPNWLYEANRKGIKTVMVNGRISVHSINNYKKIRFLTRTVLSKMDAFSMISQEDADRICFLGAPRERVKVNGNAKYDPLIKRAVPGVKEKIMNLFNFTPGEEVFIAGSTRTSEEEIVLDVYEKIRNHFPDIKLVIAPRHVERVHLVETIIKDRGKLLCST